MVENILGNFCKTNFEIFEKNHTAILWENWKIDWAKTPKCWTPFLARERETLKVTFFFFFFDLIKGLNRLILSLSKNLIPDAFLAFFELGPSYLHQVDLLTIPRRLRGQIGKKCTLRPLGGPPKVHLCFKSDWMTNKGSTHRAPGGVPLGVPLRGLRVHFLPIWPHRLRGMVKRSAWCKYEGPSSKNVEMASGIRFFDKLRK